MKARLMVHNCRAVRTIDGDSFVVIGDVRPIVPDTTWNGWQPRVRLVGVDAPERGEEDWPKAAARLETWLAHGPFNLICYGRDKYGRLLADADRGAGLLSDYLVEMGVPRMSRDALQALAVELD